MKNQITELRTKIDGLSQLVKSLKPIVDYTPIFENNIGTVKTFEKGDIDYIGKKYVDAGILLIVGEKNSNELNKCYDSLKLAKVWLGKALKELGIEPTSDIAELDIAFRDPHLKSSQGKKMEALVIGGIVMVDYLEMSYIEKVDWLREEISKLIVDYTSTINNILNGKITIEGIIHLNLFKNNIYIHLSEAIFWLDFELDRVKELESKSDIPKLSS